MKLALFSHRGDKAFGAVLEDGKLVRYEEESAEDSAAETVFLGAVDRCMGGMEAAFVRVGKGKTVFLPYREMHGVPVPPPSGTRVLVQVRRSPTGKKQAYATMDVSLAGKYAVLTPVSRKKAVSARYAAEEKAAACARLGRLCPEECGMILRKEAEEADDGAVREEIGVLLARWEKIRRGAEALSAPGEVCPPPSLEERILRDIRGGADRILTDDPALTEIAGRKAEYRSGAAEEYRVLSQLEKARLRVHHLPSGGNVVIDPCEALTAIDVNTAGDTGSKKDPEKSRLNTNLEAASEIARLIRLRDIGGIIIIDFIDMESPENRLRVSGALEEALRDDFRKTAVHGFTSLGLLEMTRKRN